MKKTNKILLISGKLQSGKNTFANHFQELCKEQSLSSIQVSFAKSLKDRAKEDFSNLTEFLNSRVSRIRKLAIDLKKASLNNLANDLIEISESLFLADENFYEDKTDLSRILLTTYGTDIFRERVSKNYWVELIKNSIEKKLYEKTFEDFTLITDYRYPNEKWVLDSIEDVKIISIRILRDLDRLSEHTSHSSETSLDSEKFDYTISNNGTLEDFKRSIEEIFKDILDKS